MDDDAPDRTALVALLTEAGYAVAVARDAEEALRRLADGEADILLADLRTPGLGSAEGMERAIEPRRSRGAGGDPRARLGEKIRLGSIIGTSPAIQEVYRTIERVAPSRATVLVTGESGTGKELVAEAIHARSPRAEGPFVKLHCAALAESLLESELFGHEKGAFTGAVARREGHFKQADGGTLFLDEIGEISPAIQVKLLRFLQERCFERVGGSETVKVDVRVIAATNRDLWTAVKEGRFREDLLYRLNVVHVSMPPLRARPVDILPLARNALERYARENGKAIEGFDAAALARIEAYSWPGNVRELENVIERAVVLCEGARVTEDDLPIVAPPPSSRALRIPGSTLQEVERHVILAALEAADGSTSRAARMLGVSVRKVQYRLHQYGIALKRVTTTKSTAPVS